MSAFCVYEFRYCDTRNSNTIPTVKIISQTVVAVHCNHCFKVYYHCCYCLKKTPYGDKLGKFNRDHQRTKQHQNNVENGTLHDNLGAFIESPSILQVFVNEVDDSCTIVDQDDDVLLDEPMGKEISVQPPVRKINCTQDYLSMLVNVSSEHTVTNIEAVIRKNKNFQSALMDGVGPNFVVENAVKISQEPTNESTFFALAL